MENLSETMMDNMKKLFKSQQEILAGLITVMDIGYSGSNETKKGSVFGMDKMKLYHYSSRVKDPSKYPVLIIYTLVNKQYMIGIQEDRSLIRKLLDGNQDVYIIDWGYLTQGDQYLTVGDYINGYIDSCVDFILKEKKISKVSLLSVCRGDTFSSVYTALNQDKIKSPVALVTPLGFPTDDGLLFKWSKYLNMSEAAETYGAIPGDLMNAGFLMLKPFDLAVGKYISLIPDLDDPMETANFMRMRQWIFDSPDRAGATIREFAEKVYHKNTLYKREYKLEGQEVDLEKITCPILVILGQKDNQVPPAATEPIMDAVGSKGKKLTEFNIDHIGIFASKRGQREVAPKINDFLNERK